MTRRNFFQVVAAAISGLLSLPALAKKAPEVKKQVVVAGNSILFDSVAFGTDVCRSGVDTHYCDEVHPTREGWELLAKEFAPHYEHAQLVQLEPIEAFVRMTA